MQHFYGDQKRSRKQWPYSLLRQSLVDHGEKLNQLLTKQDIEKLELIDFDEYINSNRVAVPSVLKEIPISTGIQESSGQKLQLQMEIYRDLSEFYQLKAGITLPDVADELNTPVFEKAHFDFDRQLHRSDLLNVITSNEDQQNSTKVKIELPNMDSVNIDDVNNILIQEASKNKELNIMSVDKDASKLLNYVVISSPGINSNQSNTHSLDNSEYEYIYDDSNKVTPMLQELVSEDDEYLPTVKNYSDIFFNNNESASVDNLDVDNNSSGIVNGQYIIFDASSVESLETSKSSTENSTPNKLFNLQLDCSKNKFAESFNTPDVIEAIDAIELEKGFNILDFITADDSIKPEATISSEDLSLQSPVSQDFHTESKQYRKRKIKTEEDDDEDYEPPPSIIKQFSSSSKKRSCLDFDIEDEGVRKPARRGRPPKKASATPSKVRNDEDDKYREMRDKNNEASRKSRLKRKMKEVAQEEEADDLEFRNIKLKAQVAELERTVNNFRKNLMELLMKK